MPAFSGLYSPIRLLKVIINPAPLDLLESIHSRRTGAMIRASLGLGALTEAGASQGQRMPAWNEYGRRLGMAFQITDDLLDVPQR